MHCGRDALGPRSVCRVQHFNGDAMVILLMRGVQQRSHLPNKWRTDLPKKKLKLKNDIIDWLQSKPETGVGAVIMNE